MNCKQFFRSPYIFGFTNGVSDDGLLNTQKILLCCQQDEHDPDDYQEIDEYEELPLNENAEGCELPAK